MVSVVTFTEWYACIILTDIFRAVNEHDICFTLGENIILVHILCFTNFVYILVGTMQSGNTIVTPRVMVFLMTFISALIMRPILWLILIKLKEFSFKPSNPSQ
jgi:hypothetical protein